MDRRGLFGEQGVRPVMIFRAGLLIVPRILLIFPELEMITRTGILIIHRKSVQSSILDP